MPQQECHLWLTFETKNQKELFTHILEDWLTFFFFLEWIILYFLFIDFYKTFTYRIYIILHIHVFKEFLFLSWTFYFYIFVLCFVLFWGLFFTNFMDFLLSFNSRLFINIFGPFIIGFSRLFIGFLWTFYLQLFITFYVFSY